MNNHSINLERKWEINGNLDEIENFENFCKYIIWVRQIFDQTFGYKIMNKIDLYIDNASKGSGYTPITTVILKKYIIIKLGVNNFLNSEQIVYQFAHELCHYVFYSLIGLSKAHADKEEESICSAMSLIVIKKLFPDKLTFWKNHVKNLKEEKYRKGFEVAEECNYDILKLKDLILKNV